MSFAGGKLTNADYIIDILNHPCFDNLDYIEPFIGYAHILQRIKNKNSYIASDYSEDIVHLHKCIQDTSINYPDYISREHYNELRKQGIVSSDRSFTSVAWSYRGKVWGGYGGDFLNGAVPKRHYKYYDKLRQNQVYMSTDISHRCYTDYLSVTDKLIYLDPPYVNTIGFSGTGKFDTELFWENTRKLSVNNWVFISEYEFPDDFISVGSVIKRNNLASSNEPRYEFLCIHNSRINDYIEIVQSHQ